MQNQTLNQVYQHNIEEGKIRKNSNNKKMRPFGSVGKTGTCDHKQHQRERKD